MCWQYPSLLWLTARFLRLRSLRFLFQIQVPAGRVRICRTRFEQSQASAARFPSKGIERRVVANHPATSGCRPGRKFQHHELFRRNGKRTLHAVLARRRETKTAIIGRPTNDDNDLMPQLAALRQAPPDERRTDPLPLAIRRDSHWGERQRLMPSVNGERAERDMTHDAIADHGDRRQRQRARTA